MKIIITGSSGKIGNEVLNFFIKKRIYTYGTYNKKAINKIKTKYFTPLKINLSNNKINLPYDVNAIIHIAFKTTKINNKSSYIKNIQISRNLLNAIKNSRSIKKLVFLSAMAIYSNKNTGPVTEKVKIFNNNYYAKSKYKSEKIFNNLKNIKVYNLRIPGVLGTKNEVNFFANLISKIKKNKKVVLYNKKNKFNNIIFINNLNNFIFKLLKNNYKSGTVILGTSKPIFLNKIVEILKKKLKSKSKIQFKFKNEGFYINISKAVLKYNFKPLSTIETIKKYLKFKKFI